MARSPKKPEQVSEEVRGRTLPFQQLTNFLLVHGGWHGSWCWSRLSSVLAARGHEVSAPTLSGLAERGHLLGPRINLSTHISDVVEAAQSLMPGELVLVGHSYGGVVISGAAEQLGARVAGLAYVDAFLPEDGQSCAMFMTGPPPPPDGVVLPPPAERFGIHRPEDRDWVDRMMTPHPANALLEPVTLRGARERVAKKCYILAVGRSRPAFEAAYEGVTNDPTWRTFRMNTGHHPMLDEPVELADLLETAFG